MPDKELLGKENKNLLEILKTIQQYGMGALSQKEMKQFLAADVTGELDKEIEEREELISGERDGEYLSGEERKAIVRERRMKASKFFGREEKKTASDTTGTSDLAIKSKSKIVDPKKLIPEPTEEKGGALAEILTGVNSIAETLKDQKKQDKKHKNFLQRLIERFKRRKKENTLEFKIFDGIKKTATKLLAPFKSAWQKMMDFIGKVLLGRVLFKILEWMGNKDNQKKLQSIIKFFEDWWPTMLAAYLLFGTGFTKMVAGIIKAVGWGIKQLAVLIPKLIAAIAKIKWAKIGKGITNLFSGGLGGKGKAFTGLFSLGASAFSSGGLVKEIQYYNEGGQVPGSGNKDTVPAMLTPGEIVMSKPAVNKIGADNLLAMNAAGGGTNKPTSMPFMGLGGGGDKTNKPTSMPMSLGGGEDKPTSMPFMGLGGGLVQGFKGGGKVMSTSENATMRGGQVVSGNMSQSSADYIREKLKLEKAKNVARQIHGFNSPEVNQIKKQLLILDGIPAEAIHTDRKGNIKVKDFSSYGGKTTTSDGNQGGGFKRMVGGAADFVTGGMFDFDKRNRKGSPKDFGIRRMAGGLTDWATMGLTDFDKRGAGIAQVNPISGGKDKAWGSADEQAKRGEKQSGMGIKRGIGGFADFATLGMFDFDKQNPAGSPKGFGPLRMMGGIADHLTMGLTDFDKRGAGIAQFNPISGGKDKKWGVEPPEKKNVITAYEEEKNKMDNKPNVEVGKEIPQFDVTLGRSLQKIKVLGISV